MATIGSLFSGIGGLELGLEWAGLGPVVWQCEIDPFCNAILKKRWPGVLRWLDVRSHLCLPATDIICGGFPCQDVSSAGKQAGIKEGTRSGLWLEFAKIVERVRPRFVIVENVSSGKRGWLPQVRGDLHLLGYDTCPIEISAADVGASHLRNRVFVIAHPYADREFTVPEYAEVAGASTLVSDSLSTRREGSGVTEAGREARARSASVHWGAPVPDMVRVVHGVSAGMDRRRVAALGNSVVPQCAEVVGKILLHFWPELAKVC